MKTKATKSINSREILELVSGRLEDIFKKMGVLPQSETTIKEVTGEESNSILSIEADHSVYALKVFTDSIDKSGFYINRIFNQKSRENNIPTPPIIYSTDDCKLLTVLWIIWNGFPANRLVT